MPASPNSTVTHVALIGAPNSGKTTLFNWLTGSSYKAVNYPGSTVEAYIGKSQSVSSLHFIDTPGTYSLSPQSPEEEVTKKILLGDGPFGEVRSVVVVVDGTMLDRQLLLAKQLQHRGYSLFLAITMKDLVERKGWQLNLEKLSQKLGLQIALIDGNSGVGVRELEKMITNSTSIEPKLASPPKTPLNQAAELWSLERKNKTLAEIQEILSEALLRPNETASHDPHLLTEKLDRVLLDRAFGLPIFFVVMFLLFSGIFWWAAPLMDGVDQFFGLFADWTFQFFGAGLLGDFFAHGLVTSFGSVLVFVPQIFILFLGISALEDSGYLARAATLIDRPMSRIGLSGKSFVPLLSGFACAIPAMLAARTISSRRDRWITLFIIPFMTCSARLPVFALLLSFLFLGGSALLPGLILACIYLTSLFVGAVSASILNRILPKTEESFFMMELPLYRRPKLRTILRSSYSRTKSYLKKAGPAIFIFTLVIWVGTNFPNVEESNPTVKLESSYAGEFGKWIEPIFEPMGVDWRVGVGLISAFAAREVFVSSLAVMMNLPDDEDSGGTDSIVLQMREARTRDGSLVFTTSSVLGLIVFFILALQCLSTTAIAARESSWRFAILQLVVMNIVAYTFSVLLVQGLRSMGVS